MRRGELRGRVVLITGASRGIGAETARRLHARGARLSLVARDRRRLDALATELGPDAAAFPADVTDRAAVTRAVVGTCERFGGIDVVIANAGVAPPVQPVLTADPADFAHTLDVDLLGAWHTVRAALPSIVERRGHVLVVSSIYAFFPGVLAAPYAISKAGVEQLGRALRVELAAHGATAGVAYLGFVDTELAQAALAPEAAERIRRTLPAWVSRPIPVGRAAAAVVRGVERRSPRVTAPWWVSAALPERGLVPLLDRRLATDRRVQRAVRLAENPAIPGRDQRKW